MDRDHLVRLRQAKDRMDREYAVFEHVRASGADVLQEPADQFLGVRDCALRDPAGNMVRINQDLQQA